MCRYVRPDRPVRASFWRGVLHCNRGADRQFGRGTTLNAEGGRPVLARCGLPPSFSLPHRGHASGRRADLGRDGTRATRFLPLCRRVVGGGRPTATRQVVTLPDSSNPLPVSNDGDQGHAISVSASIPRRRECAIQWKHAEASRYVSPSWIQRSGPLQSMCYRQGPPG